MSPKKENGEVCDGGGGPHAQTDLPAHIMKTPDASRAFLLLALLLSLAGCWDFESLRTEHLDDLGDLAGADLADVCTMGATTANALYVAPNGLDSGTGQINAPVSIKRALELALELALNGTSDIELRLAHGGYMTPIVFAPQGALRTLSIAGGWDLARDCYYASGPRSKLHGVSASKFAVDVRALLRMERIDVLPPTNMVKAAIVVRVPNDLGGTTDAAVLRDVNATVVGVLDLHAVDVVVDQPTNAFMPAGARILIERSRLSATTDGNAIALMLPCQLGFQLDRSTLQAKGFALAAAYGIWGDACPAGAQEAFELTESTLIVEATTRAVGLDRRTYARPASLSARNLVALISGTMDSAAIAWPTSTVSSVRLSHVTLQVSAPNGRAILARTPHIEVLGSVLDAAEPIRAELADSNFMPVLMRNIVFSRPPAPDDPPAPELVVNGQTFSIPLSNTTRLDPGLDTNGRPPAIGMSTKHDTAYRYDSLQCAVDPVGGGTVLIDREGRTRPINGACDVGAFER